APQHFGRRSRLSPLSSWGLPASGSRQPPRCHGRCLGPVASSLAEARQRQCLGCRPKEEFQYGGEFSRQHLCTSFYPHPYLSFSPFGDSPAQPSHNNLLRSSGATALICTLT